MNSCLYEGSVQHSRTQPVRHQFRYSLYMVYLDLDELDDVFRDAHAHGIPCVEVNSVPVANPLARVVSDYRIEGGGGSALQFTRVSEQRLDARGNPVGVGELWPRLLLVGLWLESCQVRWPLRIQYLQASPIVQPFVIAANLPVKFRPLQPSSRRRFL